MKDKIKTLEEIKANFCVARDGLVDALMIMESTGSFDETINETKIVVGDLSIAIKAFDDIWSK